MKTFLLFIIPPHIKQYAGDENNMKKVFGSVLGVLTGFINILIGACGGIVAVEGLKAKGLDQTKAHATAVSVILPLTIISAAMYLYRGDVKIRDSYVFIIPALAGSILGAWLLPKIPKNILKRIFAVFIIYAGARMILK